MKKILSVLLCALLIFAAVLPAFAAEENGESVIEEYEDGSRLVGGFCKAENESAPDILTRFLQLMKKILQFFTGGKSVSATKYLTYKDANGEALWTVYLHASFDCSRKGAKCTKAAITADLFDADWKLLSKSAAKNGDTASGEFTVRQYKLGVPLKTVSETLTVRCDGNGNLT